MPSHVLAKTLGRRHPILLHYPCSRFSAGFHRSMAATVVRFEPGNTLRKIEDCDPKIQSQSSPKIEDCDRFRSPRFLKIEDCDEDCDQDCDEDCDEDCESDFVVVLNRSPRFRTAINRSPRWQIEDYDPGLRYDRSPRKIFPDYTTVCEILTPDRDRERVREWLLPSHSRFLNPESGVTIITALTLRISHSRFSLPILKVTPETTPETAPDPEFSGSGVRNRD